MKIGSRLNDVNSPYSTRGEIRVSHDGVAEDSFSGISHCVAG
jgi:hypothetical protein